MDTGAGTHDFEWQKRCAARTWLLHLPAVSGTLLLLQLHFPQYQIAALDSYSHINKLLYALQLLV